MPAFCKEMGTGHVGNVTLHTLVKHGSGIHSLGQFHPDEQSAQGLGIGSTGREGFQLLQHGLQLNRVTFADLLDMLWQQTFLKIFRNDGLVEVGRMHIRRLLPNGALADNARITRKISHPQTGADNLTERPQKHHPAFPVKGFDGRQGIALVAQIPVGIIFSHHHAIFGGQLRNGLATLRGQCLARGILEGRNHIQQLGVMLLHGALQAFNH